ncbi:MAG: MBOAT family O-acyltransferase [Clostridia bacterium]
MLFSSIPFLYFFFPALLALYFIAPKGLKNAVLLLASVVFYIWGEPIYILLMLGSTLLGYIFGLLIDRFRGKKLSKIFMIASVVTLIGFLGLFKYADFFIGIANGLGADIGMLKLALPIGISFYTFQILSYTIDVYRGTAEVAKNPIDFAAYVTFFPQLVAGPIVRYTDVARELKKREHSFEGVAIGASRFTIGLAKKILIANVLAEVCSIYRTSTAHTALFSWVYAIAYMLHIYFDFSGYSDMAIGLGRIFGFKFPENFNYPYIAASITDFWRRWHMTLSSWFRDYVYIPLGGNRVKPWRNAFNILIVWALTGFWHGAGFTFLAWGLYFALFLLIEKFLLKDFLKKLPRVLTHTYALIIVLFSWVLFDAESISAALSTMGNMLFINTPAFDATALYYLRSYAVPLIIGIIGCTPLPKLIASKFSARFEKTAIIIKPIFVVALLMLTTAYLVDGSFNPFIYFRF